MKKLTLFISFLFLSGQGFSNVSKVISESSTQDCVEIKQTLLTKLIPVGLEGSKRSTIGIDETLPVKALIEDYLLGNPGMVVTDIQVVASSARIPHNRKRPQEAANDLKNLSLAKQRSEFMAKTLKSLQSSRSSLTSVKFSTQSTLAGPAWDRLDANLRWKAKGMTEGYEAMIEKLHADHRKQFEENGLKTPQDLLVYPTLLEAKFQPFQGFRVVISGFNKNESKCSEPQIKSKKSTGPKVKSE